MPAGKSRNYPLPGTHDKCRVCPISLVCLSGRRRFGRRGWCNNCKGAYYHDLNATIRCVVFRSKRGRYREQHPHCPVCGDTHWNISPHPQGQLIIGITHDDAKLWRERRDLVPGDQRSAGA